MPVTRVSGLPLPANVFAPPFFATSVSANGRYLQDQYGQPFLVKGDSVWDLAWKDSTTQNTVLSDRQANGFNTIITDFSSNAAGGMGTGSANGANYNGETPFTGTFTPNPTFWNRIDACISLAATYGITLFALPIDAYQTGTGQVFNSMTNAQATAYGTFLGNRYPQATYPNIVWMLGNDYNGDGIGSGGASAFDGQYSAMMAAIQATGDTRPVICELGFYESRTSDSATIKALCNLNACYTYHDTYEVIFTGRNAWTAPAIMIESAYENSPSAPHTPLNLRMQIGWSMTSGAAGEFYGNDSLWPLQTGYQAQLDTAIVAMVKAMRTAISSVAWWKCNPDTSSQLVTAGRGTQFTGGTSGATPAIVSTYVTASFSADGKVAMIYNPDTSVNTSITVSYAVMGSNPTVTAVDPTNGATTSLGVAPAHPTMGANAGGDHDWLFLITAT